MNTKDQRSAAFVVVAVVACLAARVVSWAPRHDTFTVAPRDTAHEWRSVHGKHWQIVSDAYEDATVTDAREGTRGVCPKGMVEVRGAMLREPTENLYANDRIERQQLGTCVQWLQREFPERCARFDRDAWVRVTTHLERDPKQFCIDRYEYPNVLGQWPVIFVSFEEAEALCRERAKRLCTEDEWTFACEGEEGRPYPYGDGYTRDPTACVCDAPWIAFNETAMHPRDAAATGRELDRLWQGRPSGQPRCRSPFGVYDLTGNVDEWTRRVHGGPHESILKGGYWGPVRTRCRPSTRSHAPTHLFYQQGFRCCADVGVVPFQGDHGATPPSGARAR